MKRVYVRCNGGDYFDPTAAEAHCPRDGWTSPEATELARAIETVTREAGDLSIAALRRAGASEAAVARAIIIEFGSERSSFELLAPKGYGIDGQWQPIERVDRNRFC